MRVVVTGGAGYIGWSVVNALIDLPEIDSLVVYDNFSRGNYGLLLTDKRPGYEKLSVVVDDILNFRGLKASTVDASCVCHLAARAGSPFSDEDPHAFDQVNHWGTAEVCYAVEELGVPRIVYLSSGSVYGFGHVPFSVKSEPMPVTSYGISKLAGERHVVRLGDSRDIVVLRSGTAYGMNPVARFDTFMNKFALDAALGRPIQVHGSGEQHRPVVQVARLAQIVAGAVVGRVPSGTYNVVDENVTINAVVGALRERAPGLETIFLSQSQRMRDLMLEPSSDIEALAKETRRPIDELSALFGELSLT